MSFTDYQLFVLEKGQLDCADFENLLYEYYEGELSESLKLRLDEHIEVCERCKESLEDYAFTVELAGELSSDAEEAPMPEGVSERLRAGLNAKLGLNMRGKL